MTGHLATIKLKHHLLLLHTQSVGEHLAPRQQPSCTLNWSVATGGVNAMSFNTIFGEATLSFLKMLSSAYFYTKSIKILS